MFGHNKYLHTCTIFNNLINDTIDNISNNNYNILSVFLMCLGITNTCTYIQVQFFKNLINDTIGNIRNKNSLILSKS